ncbi:hypothetical protein H1R17_01855 [Flavobacterium sp. xlx-214]|uniref:tetratricopeptide repeat protein n=1 Tax=unclassified Flavobacterium TaxID=196869 RepID=UPI0013D3703C|nr:MULTISPECIES: tetratricopeptide repeat protein [unclassified Flavobacterium]MBA5792767.1 hypothetical protein [Flavobacterium sp. xlx-221]QMI83904.1 hypothetical protein H1R17_01855 [Flavobacterium sp. xlx-214]
MKFYYFILLLFSVLCVSCQKQNRSFDDNKDVYKTIDSLYQLSFSDNLSFIDQVKATNQGMLVAKTHKIDSLYLKGMSNKAYLYSNIHPDRAQYYINQLVSESKKRNNKKYLGYSYSLKGNSFYNKALYDSAYYYFKNANLIYNDVKDSVSLGYNQIMMARIHYFYNDYNTSEELATLAIENLQAKESSYLIETYNILGSIYKNTHKYDEAIIYYQKALTLTEKKSLEGQYLRNNIASLYIVSHKYEKAKVILYDLLNSELINRDVTLQSAVLLNLGHVLFKQNNKDGLQQMVQSLQLRVKAHLELSSIENYILISDFYESKEKSTSIAYLKKALTLATKHKNIDNEILALKKLILLTPNAPNYAEKYISLNDSITYVRNQAKNQFAKMRFDYSMELQQNQQLKSKAIKDELLIQQQRNRHFILYTTIIFLVLLALFIYYYIRIKHKKEKVEENYKTEQRIATRIHDELANDVYHTMSYAENTDLSNDENKEKLLDHLEDVYHRTRNISKENSFIATGNDYVDYLRNMLLEFQDNHVKITTAGIDDFPWHQLSDIKKVVVYRVIQELLVNMKKHSQANLVMIKFVKTHKIGQIHYSDNGVGFNKNEEKIKNGLQNVETRTKTINGSITFDQKVKKGVKAIVSFPI